MPGSDPSRLTPPGFLTLFALLFALACVPVLLTPVPPLVDYPNHLARMALLARLPDDPSLQQFYALAWRPLPNLAMDALVPPLLGVMPLRIAGEVFVVATLLVLAAGPVLLHRALSGGWSAWPLTAFLFLYGRLLLWGFLNFLFGLGLAFAAAAAMVALARRGIVLRLAASAVFSLALYLAHLMAFGVYAVLVVGIEATGFRRAPGEAARRVGVAVLPFLLPLVLNLATRSGGGLDASFAAPWRKADLLFSVFDLYHRPFDIACFALVVLALGFGYCRRWWRLESRLVLPLALLFLLYLAMPSQMLGASGVDRRMPLALALAICAGLRWTGPSPRAERIALGCALALFFVRLGTVAVSWHASGQVYRTLLAGFAQLPQGARVAVAAPPEATNVSATPLVHLPVLAAVEHDGFAPTLFAIPGQQPVAFTAHYLALAEATAPDLLWRDFVAGADVGQGRALLAPYDYVVFVGTRDFTLPVSTGLTPVLGSPRLKLYRVGG